MKDESMMQLKSLKKFKLLSNMGKVTLSSILICSLDHYNTFTDENKMGNSHETVNNH